MKIFRNRCKIFLAFLFLFSGSASTQELDLSLFKEMQARQIGPAGMSGRVTAIDAVYDNPDIIYAGTASGGLWKSESGGIHWKPIFDTVGVASIGAISIYQKNPSIIWVGTGEGNPRNSQTNGYGIYRSLDAGRTWQYMGLGETRNIHRVIVHPENPDICYVGAQGPAWGETAMRGVFKTTDGGKTWEKVLYVNEKTGIGDMVIDPSNPEKLLVGMWEFRRWPWFFKSGGTGSGMYMTLNGGENWNQITHEDGLPKGELGRMGLAFAPSKPEIVYALIESKKNALYRSENGGFTWKKINDKNDIGNRPFYYADIYVDTKNENRLYTLYSVVGMSEDGGKSFETLIPYTGTGVHPDHHAWWSHPDNPDLLMNGNDGGMAISRDRGKNWRFVENLPLAQFYHINYDMAHPYNVMGGMQDNGSWVGPAYVWKSGGIRNHYWQEVLFGDGFDVVPDSSDQRYIYAMSQGGNVARVDKETGYGKLIKPVHPDGTPLRFNWNAAIAHDPFDKETIYYGSQFVHKSTDRGENWTIISPDLTTNDSTKQTFLESGGLTYDVTQAENYTSIVAIEPSPIEQGVLWVGTDDGNLQLSRDGGKSWTNLIERLAGVPAGSWIPQIHASQHRSGGAFVVVNNYRNNDYTPYLYHTTDYGQTWNRLVDTDKVEGYILSVVQDPVEPKLLFLGTELGLYISIDQGENWTRWTHGFPIVSTMDLKIHPREHDLVIGTFGRAAYILDDIRPLRALAQEGVAILEKPLVAFDPPNAYLAETLEAAGTRFAADAAFIGQNRKLGAMLTYYIKEEEKAEKKEERQVPEISRKKGKKNTTSQEKDENEEHEEEKDKTGKEKKEVKIEIFTASGDHLRTLEHKPKGGINRLFWDLDEKGVRYPGQPKPKEVDAPASGNGPSVLPGTYKVCFSYQGVMDSVMLKVHSDPRLEISEQSLKAHHDAMRAFLDKVAKVTEAIDRLDEAKESMELVKRQIKMQEEGVISEEVKEEWKEKHKVLSDSIKSLRELVLPKEDVQGIYRDPTIVSSRLGAVRYMIGSAREALNSNQRILLEQTEASMKHALEKINTFFSGEWRTYQQNVEKAPWSLVKKYDPLELE